MFNILAKTKTKKPQINDFTRGFSLCFPKPDYYFFSFW
jgi:hypothetical protein